VQPRVRLADGRVVRLDDAIGNGFALLAWGADPTFGLTAEARHIWTSIGGCFVMAKPDPQLTFHDDVPEGVIAIGDMDGRMKDWFARVPESVVLLRPDRFVAGMCSPQRVSAHVMSLADKLSLANAAVGREVGGPEAHDDVLASRETVAAGV